MVAKNPIIVSFKAESGDKITQELLNILERLKKKKIEIKQEDAFDF